MIVTIRFHLRLDKISKDLKAPIFFDYSVKNQRKALFSGLKLYPQFWDQDEQKAIYVPLKDAKRLLPNLTNTQPVTLLTPEHLVHQILKFLSGRIGLFEDIPISV